MIGKAGDTTEARVRASRAASSNHIATTPELSEKSFDIDWRDLCLYNQDNLQNGNDGCLADVWGTQDGDYPNMFFPDIFSTFPSFSVNVKRFLNEERSNADLGTLILRLSPFLRLTLLRI